MTSARARNNADRALALGSRLRQLRRAAKLTQRELAERIPMSAANLSRIETGEQGPPSDEIIERLSHTLKADPTELLTLAGRTTDTLGSDELLRELRQLRAEIKDGFARLEALYQR